MTEPQEDHWRRRLVTIAARSYYYEPDDFGTRIDAQVAALTHWLTDPTLDGRAFHHEPLNPQTRLEVTNFVTSQRLDSADADDVLVVYVTGHGVTGGSGNHYLVLPDSDEGHPLVTCYPTVDLLASVLGSQAEHILIIVDSCRAGALHSQWAALSRDLPKARRELKTLTVIASADFDAKTRIGEFAELLRLVYERLQGPAEIIGRYLTVNELFTEIASVLAQHPQLGEPILIWPPFAFHPTGTPCLPNPAYSPPSELVDAPRQQVSVTQTELDEYWISRASGRASNEDPGWYFSGRAALMESLVQFLRAGEGIQVITGVAGSGKSAILARAVTLSDPTFRRNHPALLTGIDPTALPPTGCIDAAILAREKDTDQVSIELLNLLGGNRSALVEGAFQQLKAHLVAARRPYLILVDGVDEATHPDRLITDVLSPLARLTGEDGTPLVRLLLGLRSGEHSSLTGEQGLGLLDLLQRTAQGVAINVVRTDEKPSVTADIGAYLAALISVRGPYADTVTSRDPIVQLVASRVSPSFLDARLAGDRLRDARELQNLSDPVWLATLADGTVSLFRADLTDTAGALERPGAHLLAALQATAFAMGRGVPWGDVWPTMANGIHGQPISEINDVIGEVLHSRLAGYLTQDSEDGRVVHRPNHARLAEALRDNSFPLDNQHEQVLRLVSPTSIHARIATDLADLVDPTGAIPPHPYLARHLIDHAHLGGVLDDTHVPAVLLAWEPDARVRGLLGLPPPTDASSGRLTAWASIEPFLGDATISARQLSLAFACRSADFPLPPSPITKLAKPIWTQWSLPPGNVLAASSKESPWLSMETFSLPGGPIVLVTGSRDGSVRVWDPSSGTAIGEPWYAHDEGVRALAALSLSDGRVAVATGGVDGSVRVWDPLSGGAIGDSWPGHRGMVSALVAFSFSDGRVALASGGVDGLVRTWDPHSGKAISKPWRTHGGGVTALVPLSFPDGRSVLAAAGMKGRLELWDPIAETSMEHGFRLIDEKPLLALDAFSLGDGRSVLAVAGTGGVVHVWDPLTGTAVCKPWRHDSGVSALATFALRNGRTVLITGHADGKLQLWNPLTGAALGKSWRGHPGPVTALATVRFPDGRVVLATCGLDQAVRVWDPVAESVARQGVKRNIRSVVAAMPVADGRVLLASGGAGEAAQALDSLTGTVVWEHPQNRRAHVTALVALPSPEGQVLLASGNENGLVQLWDPIDGSVAGARVVDHGDPITALAALSLPNGRVLLVCGDVNGFVQMWDPIDGSAVGEPLGGHISPIRALVALSLPDRPLLLASGDEDGLVQLWDPIDATLEDRIQYSEPDPFGYEVDPIDIAAYGEPVRAHEHGLNAMTVLQDPDGWPLLASGSSDGTVRLWGPDSRDAAGQSWYAHESGVNALAALQQPGGRALLATGGGDGTLRLWNTEHGVEVTRIVTGRRIQSLLAFSDDTHLRLAVTGDGGIACLAVDMEASLFPVVRTAHGI